MKLKRKYRKVEIHELKPDRSLLDPNFEGYKLSLEKFPSYSTTFNINAKEYKLEENQFSFQQVKLFATHNGLITDKFNEKFLYFVSARNDIVCMSFNEKERGFEPAHSVFSVGHSPSDGKRQLPISIVFPTDSNAFVCDGCSTLYFMDTGLRSSKRNEEKQSWKVLTSLDINEASSEPSCFVALDSVSYLKCDKRHVDVLLITTKEEEFKEEMLYFEKKCFDENTHKKNFTNVMIWLTFVKEDGSWKVKSRRTIAGQGVLEFARIEANGTGICVASNRFCYVVRDSEKPIDYSEDNTDDAPEAAAYFWMDSKDYLKIWFRMPDSLSDNNFKVELNAKRLILKCEDQVCFDDHLTNSVKQQPSSTGIAEISNDIQELNIKDEDFKTKLSNCKCLKVVLEKENTGGFFGPKLFEEHQSGISGAQVFDENTLNEINEKMSVLTSDKLDKDNGGILFDSQQLEECDDAFESLFLFRIDKELQIITDQAILSGHQLIFITDLSGDNHPSLCLRHDVDGLLWTPQLAQTAIDEEDVCKLKEVWNCKHVGTFSALGYVSASKKDRKYTVCPKDLSYVAICAVKKHIYIYRQPEELGNDLRNRKTGKKVRQISRQHVISTEPVEEILGSYATREFLYILTPSRMHAWKISQDE